MVELRTGLDHEHDWEISHTVMEPTGSGTNEREIAYLVCNCGRVKRTPVEYD